MQSGSGTAGWTQGVSPIICLYPGPVLGPAPSLWVLHQLGGEGGVSLRPKTGSEGEVLMEEQAPGCQGESVDSVLNSPVQWPELFLSKQPSSGPARRAQSTADRIPAGEESPGTESPPVPPRPEDALVRKPGFLSSCMDDLERHKARQRSGPAVLHQALPVGCLSTLQGKKKMQGPSVKNYEQIQDGA